MTKYIEHIKTQDAPSAIKSFFKFEDKLVWLTPFAYSSERERTVGFADEDQLLLNFRHKVHVNEYYEMA